MSQVMIVDQTTGVYFNMDCQGNKILAPDSEFIGYADSEVLMNRLAGGHIDLPDNCIAIHMNVGGVFPYEEWEFLSMVHDVRLAGTTHTQLIRTVFKLREDRNQDGFDPSRFAVLDYEACTLKWLDNPLAEEWHTNSYDKASVTTSETDKQITDIFFRRLAATLPLHGCVIPATVM